MGLFRFAVVLASAVLCGCTVSRTVLNGYVRTLDTTWIKPGVTTRAEIIARFGQPPSMVGVKGVRPGAGGALAALASVESGGGASAAIGTEAEGEIGNRRAEALRYFSSDSALDKFEGGYIVYPTFSRARQLRAHDIFILFDTNDVVRLLSRTETTGDGVRILEWKEAAK